MLANSQVCYRILSGIVQSSTPVRLAVDGLHRRPASQVSSMAFRPPRKRETLRSVSDALIGLTAENLGEARPSRIGCDRQSPTVVS